MDSVSNVSSSDSSIFCSSNDAGDRNLIPTATPSGSSTRRTAAAPSSTTAADRPRPRRPETASTTMRKVNTDYGKQMDEIGERKTALERYRALVHGTRVMPEASEPRPSTQPAAAATTTVTATPATTAATADNGSSSTKRREASPATVADSSARKDREGSPPGTRTRRSRHDKSEEEAVAAAAVDGNCGHGLDVEVSAMSESRRARPSTGGAAAADPSPSSVAGSRLAERDKAREQEKKKENERERVMEKEREAAKEKENKEEEEKSAEVAPIASVTSSVGLPFRASSQSRIVDRTPTSPVNSSRPPPDTTAASTAAAVALPPTAAPTASPPTTTTTPIRRKAATDASNGHGSEDEPGHLPRSKTPIPESCPYPVSYTDEVPAAYVAPGETAPVVKAPHRNRDAIRPNYDPVPEGRRTAHHPHGATSTTTRRAGADREAEENTRKSGRSAVPDGCRAKEEGERKRTEADDSSSTIKRTDKQREEGAAAEGDQHHHHHPKEEEEDEGHAAAAVTGHSASKKKDSDRLEVTGGSGTAFWVRPRSALYEPTASIAAKRKDHAPSQYEEQMGYARIDSGSGHNSSAHDNSRDGGGGGSAHGRKTTSNLSSRPPFDTRSSHRRSTATAPAAAAAAVLSSPRGSATQSDRRRRGGSPVVLAGRGGGGALRATTNPSTPSSRAGSVGSGRGGSARGGGGGESPTGRLSRRSSDPRSLHTALSAAHSASTRRSKVTKPLNNSHTAATGAGDGRLSRLHSGQSGYSAASAQSSHLSAINSKAAAATTTTNGGGGRRKAAEGVRRAGSSSGPTPKSPVPGSPPPPPSLGKPGGASTDATKDAEAVDKQLQFDLDAQRHGTAVEAEVEGGTPHGGLKSAASWSHSKSDQPSPNKAAPPQPTPPGKALVVVRRAEEVSNEAEAARRAELDESMNRARDAYMQVRAGTAKDANSKAPAINTIADHRNQAEDEDEDTKTPIIHLSHRRDRDRAGSVSESRSRVTTNEVVTAMLRGIVQQTRRVLPCYLCAEMQNVSTYQLHLDICAAKTETLLQDRGGLPAGSDVQEQLDGMAAREFPSSRATTSDEERDDFCTGAYRCAKALLVPCCKCGGHVRVHDAKEHDLLCGRSYYENGKAGQRTREAVTRIELGAAMA